MASFLELTFTGGRFEAHAAPVDVLAEFAVVQQLVLGVARDLYFRAHPDRQRVPRGFADAGQLYLASTRDNCFTGGLERIGPLLLSGDEEFAVFDQARDLTIAALSAVAAGDDLPTAFPMSQLETLAALGKRLEIDEGLRLQGAGATANVDQGTRARLAKMIKRPLERFETLDGEVEQLDDVHDRCVFRTTTGLRVELSFDSIRRSTVHEALLWRPIARIRVRGHIVLGSTNKMTATEGLEVVDDERAPDVLSAWDRLKLLADVKDGWCNGEGRSPSQRSIQLARDVIGRLLVDQKELPRPKLFPTPIGGVQAEWVLGRWAIDVAFDPDTSAVFAEATHADTGEERAAEFTHGEVSREYVDPLARWLLSLPNA